MTIQAITKPIRSGNLFSSSICHPEPRSPVLMYSFRYLKRRTQLRITPFCVAYEFRAAYPIYMCILAEPSNHYSAIDLGLEIEEGELARELSTNIPDSLLHQSVPEFDPDDFENIYQFFLA